MQFCIFNLKGSSHPSTDYTVEGERHTQTDRGRQTERENTYNILFIIMYLLTNRVRPIGYWEHPHKWLRHNNPRDACLPDTSLLSHRYFPPNKSHPVISRKLHASKIRSVLNKHFFDSAVYV